jgi:1,4-alpha-glucan branching enzyme
VKLKAQIAAVGRGTHGDPFKVLGPHAARRKWRVRCMLPDASEVEVVDREGKTIAGARRIDPGGVFEARMPLPVVPYRLRVRQSGEDRIIEDPYRFPSLLGDLDRHLMAEGSHQRLYDALGARLTRHDDVDGVQFAVWAPNASRVSVVGPFNGWDGRLHPMRLHPANGVWDLFLPGVSEGALYKFEILDRNGALLALKSDPLARAMEPPPGNASVVHVSRHSWNDDAWMRTSRPAVTALDRPVSIYEAHLGSWRRDGSGNHLGYRELATELVPYVRAQGFTHVELLPVSEHPFEGSWGYQPIGLFAPTCRHGSPDDFKHFVDACHGAGLGVIVDWVPAHFPRDTHGLARFDGTCLYEHEDPRQGEHKDWGTLIYNFGRPEVVNYLIACALWWIEEYHVDALRVDAVASMLYLDYSRKPAEWIPNRHGGNENLEAIDFMRRLNEVVHARGAVTIAEESTAWPMVSRPTWLGGLGYTYKWNMGWMHDTLEYMREDPVHRRYHHDRITFGLLYAFQENFILPLSHDEVVHGKGSILARMPGDNWQRFANLRLYYGFLFASPGKKLLFMGGEFAQAREWSADRGLDWELLDDPLHAGIQALVRDLNHAYAREPALHVHDVEHHGFDWIDCNDREHSIISFLRRGRHEEDIVVVVCNFTPVVRDDYRIGVPFPGRYRELLNSDAACYAGSGVGNLGEVHSSAVPAHGHAQSLSLRLPPLGMLMLKP